VNYASHASLRLALQQSGLDQLTPNNRATFLKTLADRLGFVAGRSGHGVMLLESHLGLEPGHYASHASLRLALQQSGLDQLEPNNRANFLKTLADGLRSVDARKPHAVLLLETYLNAPVSQFVTALADLTVTNRLGFVQAWLRAIEPDHEQAIAVCYAVVHYVRTVRDRDLPTYDQKRDFLDQAQRIWPDLRRVGLARAEQVRATGDHKRANDLEQHVLSWAEQFVNRLLTERLVHLAGRLGTDGSSLPAEWWSRPWSLRHASPPDSFHDGYLPPAFSLSAPAGVLTAHQSTLAPDSMPAEPRRADPAPAILERQSQLAKRLAEETSLPALLPQGTVWLRTLFEEGTLRWWALHCGDALEVLAQGRSEPGALQRLERAVLLFDLDVEAVWAASAWGGVPFADLTNKTWAQTLARALAGSPRHAQALDTAEARQHVETALADPLFQLHCPHLATLGRFLLASRESLERSPPAEVVETWCRALLDTWPAPQTADDRRQHEQRRREELDRATHTYLTALERELNLTRLWEKAGAIPWNDTDVLFQVSGPLWAAPLAWLPFGPGKRLFEQVASTSSVISLTLRQITQEEANQAGDLPRRLLSAQYLQPSDWQRMRGLANLEAALRQLAAQPGCDYCVCALGDDPQASLLNLQTALNQRHEPFGLAVVGGHGDLLRAGVILAGGQPWCGDGCDLSSLDLLILVACAIGRLSQEGERDVEGLYAQLVAHRGRAVVAARWPIADTEAATFVTALVAEYLEERRKRGAQTPFLRARALNQTRRALLQASDPVRVSFHLAAAFELYGLG
jgi:hypothetical protein